VTRGIAPAGENRCVGCGPRRSRLDARGRGGRSGGGEGRSRSSKTSILTNRICTSAAYSAPNAFRDGEADAVASRRTKPTRRRCGTGDRWATRTSGGGRSRGSAWISWAAPRVIGESVDTSAQRRLPRHRAGLALACFSLPHRSRRQDLARAHGARFSPSGSGLRPES